MAKKKLSPLVQAMNLFAQLDERDRQTLADYVRSQTVTVRPKSTAPSAGKKSSRKGATVEPTLSLGDDLGNALNASGD